MDARHRVPATGSVAVLFAAMWLLVFSFYVIRGYRGMINETRADLVGVESVRRITLKLWPQALRLPTKKLLKLEEQIRDVLDDRPVPTLSREERDAILAAAAD